MIYMSERYSTPKAANQNERLETRSERVRVDTYNRITEFRERVRSSGMPLEERVRAVEKIHAIQSRLFHKKITPEVALEEVSAFSDEHIQEYGIEL